MGLIERDAAAIGINNKPERNPQPVTAKTFHEFAALLEKNLAGVVCVFPWKNLKSSGNFEYGLDYFSESILTDQPLLFQERFGRPAPNQDNDFRNKVTAISRLKFLKELTGVDGYLVTEPRFWGDAIEPEIYPNILLAAKQRGVEPFPLPVPEAFLALQGDALQS